MSDQRKISAELTLELRSGLHATVDRIRLGRALRDAAREELERLGLPVVPSVHMEVGDGSRAVRVRLNGTLVPYPPDLLARVWQGVAPRELHPAVLDGEGNGGFPDAWLDETADAPVLSDFLVALTIALMRRRPDALLTARARGAYVNQIEALLPETKEHDIRWDVILPPLIRLTGTLADRAAVGSAVLGAVQAGLPDDDVIESAFAVLRDGSLGVLWNSGLPDWSADVASELERKLFDRLGLPLPEVRVLDGVGADTTRIQVLTAGVPGVPVAMIGRDELLVEAPGLDGIEATTILHPVTGERAMVVGADDGDEVMKAGFAVVDAKRLAIRLLDRELREQRRRLVSLSEVEHQLALLRARVPALVGAAVAIFPLAELTRIARLLVEDGISMGDLKGSLDRLLDHEASRPQLPPALTEPPTARTNGATPRGPTAQDYAEAVRAGRGEPLAAKSVIQVEPELEARLASASRREAEALAHDIRNAAWSALPEGERPVVVTSAAARRALRDVLGEELPSLKVVAAEELPTAAERRVVATLAV
jgi:hypothetical protein